MKESNHNPMDDGLWAFEITAIDGGGALRAETHFGRGRLAQARSQAMQAMKDGCGASGVVKIGILSFRVPD